MANRTTWRLTDWGLFSVVAIAAGSAIVACSSRVDIASDQQKTTGDAGSTGGASSGTGGTTSETGGATAETGGVPAATGGATAASGGNPSAGGASPGSGGSGPSSTAPACSAAPESGHCLAYMPRFYFDPASKTCKDFVYGGCEGNANNYASIDDCEETCTKGGAPVAVIPAPSCAGHGEQVSGPGTPDFTTQGFTVSRSESWGCGCATRPEFVMTYSISADQKIELRLCHDDSADPCEALCTETLTYELSGFPPSFAPDDIVFPAP
jgi:hypothetical protein